MLRKDIIFFLLLMLVMATTASAENKSHDKTSIAFAKVVLGIAEEIGVACNFGNDNVESLPPEELDELSFACMEKCRKFLAAERYRGGYRDKEGGLFIFLDDYRSEK